MAKIVVALGGNALGNNAEEQLEKARIAAKAIADLVQSGNDVVVAHGNGPQVGAINLAFEKANEGGHTPTMPLAECTAMSQGYIGYHLQQAIDAELKSRGIGFPVITMITQVEVGADDPAFQKPTKPIGSYYTEEQAKQIMAETGYTFVDDAGRGWRRVVPSPQPIDIYEKQSLATLIENKNIVIACGGGGVPVVKKDGRFEGVAAVIDKDNAAAKMAELIGADVLFILTAVERAAINFGKPNQTLLETIDTVEAQRYCDEGHFAPGSMLPKVQAGIRFVQSGAGRKSVIGLLEKAAEALTGASGTTIVGCR